MKLLRITIAVSITILALSLIFSSIEIYACFDPMDRYSIEVVLNKPGISYDIEKLSSIPNVVRLREGVYIYRSHISKDIAVLVLLEKLRPEEEPRYIGIRIEPRVIEKQIVKLSCKLYFMIERNMSSEDLARAINIAQDMGWSYKGSIEKGRAILTKIVNGIAVSIKINKVVKGILLVVEPKNKSKSVVEEVNKLLVKAFDAKPVNDIPCMKLVNYEYRPLVNSETIKEALSYELRWLREIGAIKGLSDNDMAKILEVAKPGYAGWNSRLIYFEGRWIPYYEYGPGILIRHVGCGIPFDPDTIPLEPPRLSLETVSTVESYTRTTTTIDTSSAIPFTTTYVEHKPSTTASISITSKALDTAYLYAIAIALAIGIAIVVYTAYKKR